MLSISLDEGAVFDILSINIVKYQKNPSQPLADTIMWMKTEIKNQVGIPKFLQIIESDEFKELVRINEVVLPETFKMAISKDIPKKPFFKRSSSIPI
jgi:hypothetical protein